MYKLIHVGKINLNVEEMKEEGCKHTMKAM